MQVCACAGFKGLHLKTLKGSFQKLTKQLPSAVLLSLRLCASFVFFRASLCTQDCIELEQDISHRRYFSNRAGANWAGLWVRR